MKTSLLICATCLIVTGCSAQLRFPSLSSALSSLTGFGSGAQNSGAGGGGSGSSVSASSSSSPSSAYSGLVRDYGRNLMMAMSSIYPTLFKPPQSQQQQQQSQPAPQSPFEQFGASQYGSQGLFPSQSAPSFSFGGSTFSISPSLPFGSLTGASSQQQGPAASHSPFSASFGSSINSPSSFGPLSSASFLPQSMPSFSPASSYNAAFESANGGPPSSASFNGLSSGIPSGPNPASSSIASQGLMPQSSNTNSISTYSSMPAYNGQHESASQMLNQQHQQQQGSMSQQGGIGSHSSAPFGNQHNNQPASQYTPQQYRPDMMSIAASAPVPSSNSYSNFASIPSGQSSQQAQAQITSFQQPSYR